MYTFVFLSALFVNSSSILLRLCGILKALKSSVDLVQKESAEKFELNESLTEEIDSYKEDTIGDDQRVVIQTSIVEKAYNLLEYFNKNKLVLAGYVFDLNAPLKTAIVEALESMQVEQACGMQVKSEFKKPDCKMTPEMRKEMTFNAAINCCLLFPGNQFTLKDLLTKYANLNKTAIIDAFECLIEKKLGDVTSTIRNGKLGKNGTLTKGETETNFTKTSVDMIKGDPRMQRFIESYITMDEYARSFGIHLYIHLVQCVLKERIELNYY